MESVSIREMTIGDFDEVIALLQRTPGVTVRDADSRRATELYLARNPGLSFVARQAEKVVGCVLCGHDGRRGYLQHLIVEPQFRNRGLGRKLWNSCLDGLEKVGIVKTHLDVLVGNDLANRYWAAAGWVKRDDIYRYSFNRSQSANA
jgi:ribosomal protein S18 acetylase RimI-like enzyme